MAAKSEPLAARRPAPVIECATASPAGLGAAAARLVLDTADAGTRQRLAASLQRQCGNAAVQRLLAPGAPPGALPAIQRWAVGLSAGEANCLTVASYVNKHTPYQNTGGAPGWARTHATFDWSGTPVFATSGGTTTATVSGASVTKSVNVDMPIWAPTDPVMKKAWATAIGELRAHEAKHEGVASDWETNLKTNLSGLTVTVTAQNDAAFRTAVKKSWDPWIAQHAADQKALDPFGVTVDCAAAESESATTDGSSDETASADDATGAATSSEDAAAGEVASAGDSSSAEAVASNDEGSGDVASAGTAPADDERDDETAEAA
jgi:predicted secreted Zn-dependent protease